MTKILIVDDYDGRRATDFLGYTGLPNQEYTYAENIERAAALIKAERFDLIIMDKDLTNAGNEGQALIKLARSDTPNKNSAIVGWTSSQLDHYKIAMLNAGADAFSCKHYTNVGPLDAFRMAVNKALAAAKGRDPEHYSSFPVDVIEPPSPPQNHL
jgi:CheY-like chemotaxis protein